jgi:transcriptional regulator with XRE-family HTH domain
VTDNPGNAAGKNDYDADVNFGHWLREIRTAAGLSLEEACLRSGITEQRLKSLEVGYASKGIVKSEAQTLATLYRQNLDDFMKRAAEADEV